MHKLALHPWSCLLDAFSIALNIPALLIEKAIQHDGGRVVWEGLPEPMCRAGFHIQELIDFCYENGYLVTEIQVMPSSLPCIGKVKPNFIFNGYYAQVRLEKYLKDTTGVLVGSIDHKNRHAIAWIFNNIIDPAGRIIELKDFHIESYFMITKSNQ